jgi:8-oxo-dGTP diphosphatase
MAPVVGVGVGVLVIRNGKVLLGRRRGSHGAGTWSAPGGRLEYGESVEDCARRELLEEAGLELGAATLGPYTNDVFAEVQEHYLTLFVLAGQTRGEPRNLEPHKCDGWSWFGWDEWPAPLFAPLQSLRGMGFTLQ